MTDEVLSSYSCNLSVMRRLAVATALLLLAAPDADACRCAQQPLDEAFDRAEIVLVGEITGVRTVEEASGGDHLEVAVEPRFRQGRPFKGDLAGLTLATATHSAACGVPVETGETYLVFATRQPGSDLAWFTTCSGSRLYAGGTRAAETTPFPDLPVNRIVPRLFELAAGVEGGAGGPGDAGDHGFHTSPACWGEPRVHHTGRPPEALRRRVEIAWRAVPRPTADASRIDESTSPNGAYQAWTLQADTGAPPPWQAGILVDVERRELLWLTLRDVAGTVGLRWINEKLLYLRVPWGRVVWSDLIVDVEAGRIVYQEQAVHGQVAFEQFHAACAGQCPCAAEPGTADDTAPVPETAPASGPAAAAGELASRLVGRVAYLVADWDGRVYSRPGLPLHTVSALAAGDGTVEAEVRSVREVAGTLWLEVDLYAEGPCGRGAGEPAPRPAHHGWVPAYTASGGETAGVYPGGC